MPPGLTPQEIARDAVKLLTSRKLPPTPDNFQTAYHEVAGTRPLQPFPLEKLRQLTQALPDKTPGQQRLKTQVGRAVSMHSWEDLQKVLTQYLLQTSVSPTALPDLPARAPTEESSFPPVLLEQMARIVGNALPAVGNDDEKIIQQAEELVNYLRLSSQHPETLRKMMADFAFRLSFVAEEQGMIRTSLLELLNMVFEHISELSPDNPWLKTQMAALIQAAQPPLSARRLEDLQRRLQDVIRKQSEAVESTLTAQSVMRETLGTFIERLAQMTENSGHYRDKFEQCAKELESAASLSDMAPVLQEAIQATRSMAEDSQRVGAELQSLRDRTEQAEAEIQRLRTELDQLSAAASHDMLTGVLNRKGLEEVVERELARARRKGTPTCLALLDIDNFKRINDELGHDTGDQALKHLANVAKNALRPQDSVARFGGEEFVVVLPDTELNDATEVIARLQRELTKQYFLEGEKRMLITFSAGVTQWRDNDSSADVIKRADQAMYAAKRAGKNRVNPG